MIKKYIPYFICFVVGLALGLTINSTKLETSEAGHLNSKANNKEQSQLKTPKSVNESGVPKKVYVVLDYILKHDNAPEGYVGGRKFKNFEGHLPNNSNGRRINYREWDVNPKTKGKNRGKERLVTGDNNTAYFTKDHYNSFIKIELNE